jgi:hypothetical protein
MSGLEGPEDAKRPPEHLALVAAVLPWFTVSLDSHAPHADDFHVRRE